MLTFDSIIFKYDTIPILRGVFLSVPASNIVGLFGYNGSGKSTLMKIGSGELTQDDGSVFINNNVLSGSLNVDRYNYIGYLSQDSFLPKDLTVINFLRIAEVDKSVYKNDSLINKILNQKIRSLSGGELRYLEIKFLFSLERDYYLLDEPFTGIEPLIIQEISELILKEKAKGKGILISDHYYRYVIDIIDKCYLINYGYITEFNQENDFRSELVSYNYLPK